MGPISKKVIAGLKKTKSKKIINLQELKDAKSYAEKLEKTFISENDLSELDPLHSVYVYAQNTISAIAEQLSELSDCSKLMDIFEQAQDTYMPSFPPISPVTLSYFTCWQFFDVCVGIKKESLGTIICDILRMMTANAELITITELMCNSRMGIFIYKGHLNRYIILEELITGEEHKVLVPSGYQGKKDEIWFARLMHEPFPNLNYGYSVVFTTPYVLIDLSANIVSSAAREDWEAFFNRNLKVTGKNSEIKAYETFMKNGNNTYYWNEYIMDGYVNYQEGMIWLAGFPDIPLSLPHSRESLRERNEL